MSSTATRRPESDAALRQTIDSNPGWYHTIELAPGVVTPGHVDWRPRAAKILPASLAEQRALDVGTFDGFWAFEMERRGASVVAIDVEKLNAAEWPPINRDKLERTSQEWGLELGRGFRIAHGALGSSVERVVCNVYDLAPDAIGGPVDVAFLGALLLHLRDPVRALENIRRTLRPGGRLLVAENVSLRNTLRSPRTPLAGFEPELYDFNWWRPNVAGLLSWLRVAGFVQIRRLGLHHPPSRKEMRAWYCAAEAHAPAR